MSAQRETVYVKADKNIEVNKADVTIGDVMKVECADSAILARVKSLKLLRFRQEEQQKRLKRHLSSGNRVAVSIMKVLACIHEVYPNVDIQNMGEKDFIVTYEKKENTQANEICKLGHILKVLSVVLISFTGAAFSIMSFNNDVDITGIFANIYLWTTGTPSDGFTVIELCYSIGISIGILVFFNHFGKRRFTVDPTPIEVEMRLYENDIQTTIIENNARKERELDVDS